MLRRKLYYAIKPLLPWSVRRGVRAWFARRKRERTTDVWPILPGSERPPEGWPGWPDGKQFALVLTHDVEGPAGVANCPNLMRLEQKLGYRSSFNFIPEGTYRVAKTLRDELTANGFEIGVHDLNHDGKLFSSHHDFRRKAARINEYLKEWGAVGFRAGFMLRNLEWLKELNVRYEASTFDTDPFEPQSDGTGSIFPFWISRDPAAPDSPNGFVELPYTLPQDSTLFLVFRERHPDIWLQKLDWIARHGGMALVNVHPDYLQFPDEPSCTRAYPVEHYTRLLEYARERYGDTFWQPLPRELAAFAADIKPRLRHKPRRVCMFAYSHYASDARITRYAEALAGRGDLVDVVALRSSPEAPAEQMLGGVHVVNLQTRADKSEKSRRSFLLPVLRFLAVGSLWIARRHARTRYDLLHIHNVPDFLVFAAWFPRLTGAKVILDIHDILPEFYASKFSEGERSKYVRLLKCAERASARVAHHVIIANHLWLDKYAARTRTTGRCSVFINNVDNHIFQPHPRVRQDDKLVVIFPGGLQWHQGLDIAIRALPKVRAELPRVEFHIYGDGNAKPQLVSLAADLGLNGSVRFFDPVPVRQVAGLMADADLGIVPKRADSFGNEAYSTKIMEFMSVGVPVVVSKTRIDQYYFNDSVVRFFESGNSEALAEAMIEVLRDRALRERLVANASAYAAQNSWDSRKGDYLALVDGLLN